MVWWRREEVAHPKVVMVTRNRQPWKKFIGEGETHSGV
jgi:hypothetical protein